MTLNEPAHEGVEVGVRVGETFGVLVERAVGELITAGVGVEVSYPAMGLNTGKSDAGQVVGVGEGV